MTRQEVEKLRKALNFADAGNVHTALVFVKWAVEDAEREHATEDRHNDTACRPVNLGEAA